MYWEEGVDGAVVLWAGMMEWPRRLMSDGVRSQVTAGVNLKARPDAIRYVTKVGPPFTRECILQQVTYYWTTLGETFTGMTCTTPNHVSTCNHLPDSVNSLCILTFYLDPSVQAPKVLNESVNFPSKRPLPPPPPPSFHLPPNLPLHIPHKLPLPLPPHPHCSNLEHTAPNNSLYLLHFPVNPPSTS